MRLSRVRSFPSLLCQPVGLGFFSSILALALLLSLGGVLPTQAAALREHWAFAWDLHPHAGQLNYFDLEICINLRCWITPIQGGSTTTVYNVFVDPTLLGHGTAVLRACRADRTCSGNSNTVILDRTPPDAPTELSYGFNSK